MKAVEERVSIRKEVAKDAKNRYRELCASEPVMSLFDQDWWLDVTCGGPDNWDVILVERGGEIVASMPYHLAKKGMFQVISQPQLTLTMGIRIRYPEGQSLFEKLSYEREIYQELIDRLPAVDFFNQQFHPDMTNWSIFYWKGFRQTSRFTYVLEDISDPARVYEGFSESVRADLRKAEPALQVVESDDVLRFHEVNKRMFAPPLFTMPYDFEVLKPLDDALKSRGRRKILFAVDGEGVVHCAIYLVWDVRSVYYFLGGENPESRESGAHSLLVWHAIKEMSAQGKQFDFHGGMHEPIERIYRSFGASQRPYFQISKINGRLFKLAYHLKQAIR